MARGSGVILRVIVPAVRHRKTDGSDCCKAN
jgi:hypothetical protein